MARSARSHLEDRFRKIGVLNDAQSVLQWDMATMMPDGGAEARGEQLALLSTLSHDLLTAPDMADLLDQAQADLSGDEDDWTRANLHEMRRQWRHAAAVPADLVEALSRAQSSCEMIWRQARAQADFASIVPSLRDLLRLVRITGQAKSDALGVGIYDALLDQYEPDGRSADIDAVFADLEAFLPGFLALALDTQAKRPAPIMPSGPFPAAIQHQVGLRIMQAMGFDFTHGRLDTSHHPFCGGYPADVRLTTRYDENDLFSALFGVIHETGHALYDFGLPQGRWTGQPVAQPRGMQMHESQSLLMEMQAARGQSFLGWLAPVLREAFGASGPAWEPGNLRRIATRVKPGFIRIEADEVTYPAHIIIRYRLEKALIENRMDIEDLPAAWTDGYQRLLGLTPPDDGRGCLQDIHWFSGSWGYFPTYTLGAMTAAQLFDTAKRADTAIEPALGQGDFAPLLAWLRPHVHGQGSRLSTRDLLIQATGRPLDAEVFKTHLRNRYLY